METRNNADLLRMKQLIASLQEGTVNENEETYTDHEVSMAASQLLSSVKSANRIAKHIKDLSESEGLEAWVASKLTLAEEYLQTVADHMDGEKLHEGYKVLPPMDKEKYQARSGLEGPFSTLSGKVVYYDPKEGKYYDPDTDMYMSYDEFQKLDNDYSGMKDERDEVKEAYYESTEGSNAMNTLRKIVADKQNMPVKFDDGSMKVDLFSASAITQVYDAVKPETREKIDRLLKTKSGMMKVQAFSMKQYESVNEADIVGDNYANVYYDYSEGFYMIDVYKDGKKVAEYDDYIGANEEGDPIKDKFLELVKKAGLEPEGLNLISTGGDEPDEYGVFKNGKFNWDKNSKVKESTQALTEEQFDEAAGEKDACYHKVKSRYKVWPSAYASGALVKCRKVGAKNWGNSKK